MQFILDIDIDKDFIEEWIDDRREGIAQFEPDEIADRVIEDWLDEEGLGTYLSAYRVRKENPTDYAHIVKLAEELRAQALEQVVCGYDYKCLMRALAKVYRGFEQDDTFRSEKWQAEAEEKPRTKAQLAATLATCINILKKGD